MTFPGLEAKDAQGDEQASGYQQEPPHQRVARSVRSMSALVLRARESAKSKATAAAMATILRPLAGVAMLVPLGWSTGVSGRSG